MLKEPVVERPVILKLEGADGMGHAFEGVRLPVREVVIRVDAPGGPGARMDDVQDAVDHRVAQVDVSCSHVDLGAQYAGAVGKFAGAHAAEKLEILLDAAVAIGGV